MNRQVNHIIHAIIILIFISFGFGFFQKISSSTPSATDKKSSLLTTQEHVIPLSNSAAKGKILFMSKCASCHALFKDMTGPGIIGFLERGPWVERKNVYEWIRNPSAFMEKNEYAKELLKRYNTMMTGFPDLTNEEIDAICDYIKYAELVSSGLPVAKN